MKYIFLEDNIINLKFTKDELNLFKYKRLCDYFLKNDDMKNYNNLNVIDFLEIKDGLKLKSLYESYNNKISKINGDVLEYLINTYQLDEFYIQNLNPEAILYLLNKKYNLNILKDFFKEISENNYNPYYYDGRIYMIEKSYDLKKLFYKKDENCTLNKLFDKNEDILNVNFLKKINNYLNIYISINDRYNNKEFKELEISVYDVVDLKYFTNFYMKHFYNNDNDNIVCNLSIKGIYMKKFLNEFYKNTENNSNKNDSIKVLYIQSLMAESKEYLLFQIMTDNNEMSNNYIIAKKTYKNVITGNYYIISGKKVKNTITEQKNILMMELNNIIDYIY